MSDVESGNRWTKEFVRQMDRLSAPLLRERNGNGSERERQSVQNCEIHAGRVSSGGNVNDETKAMLAACANL